jgi:tripartite-type tricarboxylate transporter receptor subunit TctC
MKGFRFAVVLGLVAASVAGAAAWAADKGFPNRPLRYIVPFPPGGSTDIVARIIADGLTVALGEQVVIDNRGGAAGTLGAAIAAQSTPDGYTIFACNIASLGVSPALYKKLPYDPVKDFAPVGLIGSNPNLLAVHPSVPAKSIQQFIDLAKSQPGKLNYASAGVGTSPQLSMEMLKMKSGIDLAHIPYKGAGPALVALTGGEVHAMFSTVGSLLGAIRANRIRPLAVTSSTRAPDLPDVPTIAETVAPGFEVISWQGLCTPSGVPPAALNRIRAALEKVFEMPDTKKRLADQGIQLTSLAHQKFAAFIKGERDKWAKLVNDVGIPKL